MPPRPFSVAANPCVTSHLGSSSPPYHLFSFTIGHLLNESFSICIPNHAGINQQSSSMKGAKCIHAESPLYLGDTLSLAQAVSSWSGDVTHTCIVKHNFRCCCMQRKQNWFLSYCLPQLFFFYLESIDTCPLVLTNRRFGDYVTQSFCGF
ncbi:hypothetical protein CEXT_505591 [Caerostris extrusa]|uniref:Uncharacterized protein n=1 Tax=Caerostris extrusa TaxID=172846 RepID=A0AAV4X4M2_CAEEX|nr:hypothetical protein CEXT_505591 [Caerostris extrusa]